MTEAARRKEKIALVVISLATLAAVFYGWRLFWFLTDDAFIAFRYISNSHLGYGYVWNGPPFRPVEGYTSFLWVALLDLLWRVTGVEPPAAANYVSLVFSCLTLLIGGLMLLRMQLRKELAKYRLLFLGLVLIGVISNRTFLAWSSSGLETAMFNFFLTLWIYCCFFVGPSGDRRRWIFGLTLVTALLCLTRPDGLLFAIATIVLVSRTVWEQSRSRQDVLRRLLWAAPLVIIPAHLFWRRTVYGAWLPNTYYAKTVAGRIWPESGVRYCLSFMLEYSLWVCVLLLIVLVVIKVRGRALRETAHASLSPSVVCLTLLGHFLYYTIVVGGDHFEYRVYSHLVLLAFITFVWLLNALRLRATPALLLFLLFLVFSWPIPWIHWSATHNLTTFEQTYSLQVPVAKAVRQRFPSAPNFLLAYLRVFDGLQAWLINHKVCIRHQEHKVLYLTQKDNLPSRAEGSSLSSAEYPVLPSSAVGVTAWVLPRVNIIDLLGLNDYVIARNPDSTIPIQMAHERQAPAGYVECFSPNVVSQKKHFAIAKRAVPLTADGIVECERRFAAVVAGPIAFRPVSQAVRNVIDDPQFFARQQYLDVLNRQPDPDGLSSWTGVLKRCPGESPCFHTERASVVLRFLEAPESQLNSFFVFRLYTAAFGRAPRFTEFQSDRELLATYCRNDWSDADEIATGQRAFVDQWVRQDSFRADYPEEATAEEFVNRLFDSAGLRSLPSERRQLIEKLRAGKTRGEVLRDVVENEEFKQREHDRALVLLQFFFQLRRDIDYHDGRYKLWLDKLNGNEPVDYRRAICLFLTSDEYQLRFGPIVTHNNAECR